MAKVKSNKSPTIIGNYEVPNGWVKEFNFFDMTGKKAGTKGTSNKFYHIELQIDKDNNCQIFTQYGPTGVSNPTKEWRYFATDKISAEKEFNRIIKSKIKKGYKEIDVAQRVHGSVEAQKQTKAVLSSSLIIKDKVTIPKVNKLSLTMAQKSIVQLFFKAQDSWVAEVLKCPLGQLTNKQIDLGRKALDEAKLIINASSGKLTSKQIINIDNITNDFYGLIPHNLGSGVRGQMTHLRLDSLDKIVEKEGDLDILLDAKQVNAILLKQDPTLDNKYKSLNCDFDEVTVNSSLFKFLSEYFYHSKVNGHGYGASKVTRIWSMKRKDSKESAFINNAERIAKEANKNTFAQDTEYLSSGKSKLWIPNNRPDLDKDTKDLFNKANVWLCWHGTRSANLVGITRRGLLIRPTGAIHTGSLYGDGKYFSWQSTKSLNYCDGGYWTGGNKSNKKYMFLLDVALGNMHLASGGYFYKGPPKGCHSVYAKANRSGVRNDEMITYDFDDQSNQSGIKYLFEIE